MDNRFINNPFDILMKVFDTYCLDKIKIVFDEKLKPKRFLMFTIGACGYTTFNDDGSITINISTNIPFEAMVETLAHELAHVMTGPTKEEHSITWEKNFRRIHEDYNRILSERCTNKEV